MMASCLLTIFALLSYIRLTGGQNAPPPNWMERSHVDAGTLSLAGIIKFEIKSYGTVFSGTSYLDADKQAPEAYLDGNSWMANRFTDTAPVLYADLGSEMRLCGFVIGGRPTWENDHARAVKFYVSNDNVTWTEAADKLHYKTYNSYTLTGGGFLPGAFDRAAWDRIGELEFPGVQRGSLYRTNTFKQPMTGRYIKVQTTRFIPGAAVAIRIGFLHSCEYADFCDPNPCINGGTCTSSYGSYVCTCAPNYGGLHCQNTDVIKEGLPEVCSLLDTEPDTYRNCLCYCPDKRVFNTNNTAPVDYYEYNCQGQLREHPNYESIPDFTPIPFKCPPGDTCTNAPWRVWGNYHMYTDDSSICRSAIHTYGAGFLQEGTILHAYKVGTNDYFPPVNSYGVDSREYIRLFRAYTLLKTEADLIRSDGPR